MTKRICLWSGPRNISTALMYSFAQRTDTKVYDEPLYGYYLNENPDVKSYHPGADEIIASMENDGKKVIDFMTKSSEKPVLFFKNMTHHLAGLDWDFMKSTSNIILTRDPRQMLPSFDKVIPNPSLKDVGYAMQNKLLNYYQENELPVVVIEAREFLLNPELKLRALCERLDLPFQKEMLSWKPQKRAEDGIWAEYWYKNVHQSKGFNAYAPRETEFPDHLKNLLQEALPYYDKLLEFSI